MQNNSVTIHEVDKENLNATKFINIFITFRTSKEKLIKLTDETYIVDKLSILFILDNNIRILNKIDIICDSSVNTSALKINN